jgi:hypothetical protein
MATESRRGLDSLQTMKTMAKETMYKELEIVYLVEPPPLEMLFNHRLPESPTARTRHEVYFHNCPFEQTNSPILKLYSSVERKGLLASTTPKF